MKRKIYNYWFKKDAGFDKWFIRSQNFDDEITHTFKTTLRIHKSLPSKWAHSKLGFLSYIILTDQFPRHMYRSTEKAYSYDEFSLKFMKKHILDYIFELNPEELMFALMPLQHSEAINDQLMGIAMLKFALEYIHPNNDLLKEALKHQKAHHKVIQKFGRFPKRNEHLRRKSTQKELKYLKTRKKSNHY